MTDRLLASCCYGSAEQHAEWTPCPVLAEMVETSPGHWNDSRINNTFIDRRRGYFVVSIRAAGNRSVVISRHRKIERALVAATALANGDQSIFSDHSLGRAH